MILVAGGCGRLGGLVARDLAGRGHPVRVMSRHASAAPGPTVEVVVGDVRDARAVGTAMSDVSVVVSAVQGLVGRGRISPATVDRDGNAVLIEAAGRQGADVILMSVSGAAADAPWELGRMKYAAERRLSDSGCPGTVIRPAAFVQTWLDVLRDSAGRGQRPRVLGRGDNPIPWVDVREVAAAVVRAVEDRSLRSRTLDVVGPERLTLDQLARVMMARLGWVGSPQHVPRPVVRAAALSVGLVVPQVRRLCQTSLAMDEMDHPDAQETHRLLPDLTWSAATDVVAGVLSTGPR